MGAISSAGELGGSASGIVGATQMGFGVLGGAMVVGVGGYEQFEKGVAVLISLAVLSTLFSTFAKHLGKPSRAVWSKSSFFMLLSTYSEVCSIVDSFLNFITHLCWEFWIVLTHLNEIILLWITQLSEHLLLVMDEIGWSSFRIMRSALLSIQLQASAVRATKAVSILFRLHSAK